MANSGERIREKAADRMRAVRRAATICEVHPPTAEAEVLRLAAEAGGVAWARAMLPDKFYLPVEPLHQDVFAAFGRVMAYGGRQALAGPRGLGKTTDCISEILRGVLTGQRRFVLYLCENKDIAESRLAIVKATLEKSPQLLACYPAVCEPIRALEGRANRAKAQNCRWISDPPGSDRPGGITWRTNHIVLPAWPKAPSNSARLVFGGIESGVRGLLDEFGRPDLVVIDDPIGDESALSPSVVRKRRSIIRRGLAQLGGMGGPVAMIYLGTIIEKDDVTDEFTNPEKQPAWNGMRFRFLEHYPDALDLWAEYVRLRREVKKDDPFARAAHAYYIANRAAMDAGAVAALPSAYAGAHVIAPPATKTANILADGTEREASAVEHYYNVVADDGEDAALAELQNEPVDPFAEGMEFLEPEDVLKKASGLEKDRLPAGAHTVTAFIDCGQETHVHWAAVAWSDGFTGQILDYGREPVKSGGLGGIEAALTAAVRGMVDKLAARAWAGDSATLKVKRIGVDSGWKAATIYALAEASLRDPNAFLIPTKGIPGEREFRPPPRIPRRWFGHDWSFYLTNKRDARLLMFDSDSWKTFLMERLRTPIGGAGCMTLWGEKDKARKAHREFAEHLTAERAEKKARRDGDLFLNWTCLPGRANHWLDCVVGCCVLAALEGVRLLDTTKHVVAQPAPEKASVGGVGGGYKAAENKGGGWKIGR